jgi:hypothetical protein
MNEADRDKVRKARKAALILGGLTALLLVPSAGQEVKWDPDKARFIVNGRTISYKQVQVELRRIDMRLAGQMSVFNDRLQSKQWTIAQWFKAVTEWAIASHLIYGALSAGGLVASVSNSVVRRRTERDLTAIKRFKYSQAKGLLSKLQADGRIRAYIRSLHVTYHLLSQRMHILAGYTEARRILTPAEHCRTKGHLEGCFEAAARGWMPIREMPPIGTLVCMQFCKCWILYRK